MDNMEMAIQYRRRKQADKFFYETLDNVVICDFSTIDTLSIISIPKSEYSSMIDSIKEELALIASSEMEEDDIKNVVIEKDIDDIAFNFEATIITSNRSYYDSSCDSGGNMTGTYNFDITAVNTNTELTIENYHTVNGEF